MSEEDCLTAAAHYRDVRIFCIRTQCFWSEYVLTFLHPIVHNGFGMNAFRTEVPEIIGVLISPVRIDIAFYTASRRCLPSPYAVAMALVFGGWPIRLAYCNVVAQFSVCVLWNEQHTVTFLRTEGFLVTSSC